MEKKILFFEGSSFVGTHYYMVINGCHHTLLPGHWRCDNKFGDEYDHAILILKNEYGVFKTRNDIVFVWDGTL